MPQPLLVTMISTGSSLPGRVLQTKQRGEVALGGAGVAAGDDRDAVAAMAFLHQGRARGHGILHLDHGRDRQDVPFAHGEMSGKIAAQRMSVADRMAICRMP